MLQGWNRCLLPDGPVICNLHDGKVVMLNIIKVESGRKRQPPEKSFLISDKSDHLSALGPTILRR